ncbi:hypothetical protein [Magnetofaba australis]|uniref:Uncharacterized protein n=1 Tax=Magnetofaba australis IT-1 TaxID=1434232 RepID=A0A1Y2K1R4_9PROT|nr:hypothetical protein [Magnetofaba australis]OSM01953.1 hypothetical protein MAIT1_02020 [Magnetofaba australis IT-1]
MEPSDNTATQRSAAQEHAIATLDEILTLRDRIGEQAADAYALEYLDALIQGLLALSENPHRLSLGLMRMSGESLNRGLSLRGGQMAAQLAIERARRNVGSQSS